MPQSYLAATQLYINFNTAVRSECRQRTAHLRIMPDYSPLQLGTPSDLSDEVRVSMMRVQHENKAIYSNGNQNRRFDLCRIIEDR